MKTKTLVVTIFLMLIYFCNGQTKKNVVINDSCIINPKFITCLDHELIKCPIDSRVFSPLTTRYNENLDFKECGTYGYNVYRVTDLKNLKYDEKIKALRIELYAYSKQNTSYSKELLSIDFTKFKNLEFLDITSNYIDSIPESIFSLQNLKLLKISCTKIKTLPNRFNKLVNLETLVLDYNDNLTHIPESISKLNKLQSLEISRFNGDSLPFKLSTFNHLRDLRIRENEIISSSIDLTSNKELESIYLTSINSGINHLKNLRNLEIFNPLALNEIQEISNLTTIVELSVSVNDIDDIAPLTSLPNLKYLYVSLRNYDNFIFKKYFKFNDLDYLGIGSRNMNEIDSEFLNHFTQIKYLHIWCKTKLTYDDKQLSEKGIRYLMITGKYKGSPKNQILSIPEYNLTIKKKNIHY